MAKKKWKFTDLSDDEIETNNQSSNKENLMNSNFNIDINEISNKKNILVPENRKDESKKIEVIDHVQENNINVEDKKIEDSANVLLEEKKNESLNIYNSDKNNNVSQNTNQIIEDYTSKYDINIDYDSEIPIKQQIKQQQNNLINTNVFSIKQQQKHKTFNETLNTINNVNDVVSNQDFNENKIQQFFTTKEKLDVKTNIYLKPNLVNEIQILSKKTGESRSAIINKLIEHALKDIKNR